MPQLHAKQMVGMKDVHGGLYLSPSKQAAVFVGARAVQRSVCEEPGLLSRAPLGRSRISSGRLFCAGMIPIRMVIHNCYTPLYIAAPSRSRNMGAKEPLRSAASWKYAIFSYIIVYSTILYCTVL